MAFVTPRQHFFSEKTQEMNNGLPQWHDGRKLRSSNWAQITNATWGMMLEDYKREEQRAFRNLHLETAHLDEVDILRSVQLPGGTDLDTQREVYNFLRNGSFELRSRPDKVGDFWEHTGTVDVTTPTLFGASTAQLTPAAAETSRISQSIEGDAWNSGESRTFSAWYSIPAWSGGTIPAASHGLIIVVTYGDASTATFRTAFAEQTAGEWRRISLTITPTRAIDSYEVRLETARSGAFNIPEAISLDAVQAEIGEVARTWLPNLLDSPNWFQPDLVPGIGFDGPVPIFITNSAREFHQEAVPTRAELSTTNDISSTADRRGGFAEATDFYGESWFYTWTADTGANKIQRIGLSPEDLFEAVDISLFTGRAEGRRFEEDVAGLTYRTVAGTSRWLFVIHEMTGLNGETIVALSIVDPRVPFPAPDHYESKHTIQLPLETGLDYHRAEFRFEDPQHLYVTTGAQEYVLRLFYDYAIVEPLSLRVFFREPYTGLALTR